MTRPAVFFDRDNTLIASDGYVGDPSGVTLIDGAADAVAAARALGYATVVFSNQSGVARGMFGEEAVHAVNDRLDELLQDHNHDAVIDRHEFCPFHPEATVERYRTDSDLRKPKSGMILQAAAALGLDLSRSWVIGDAPRDIEAGKAAGCRTILVRNPGLPRSPAADAPAAIASDYTVDTLTEAVAAIDRAIPGKRAARGAEEPANHTAAVAVIAPAETPAHSSGASATVAAIARDARSAVSPEASRGTPALATTPPQQPSGSSRRLEVLGEQILVELRSRRHEQPDAEFSVSKLLGGIVQVTALAALFIAYIRWDDKSRDGILLVAIVLQTLTIALIIMGRQR